MPRDGVLTLFNVDDAKLFELTGDTASALTYANPKDIPGIQEISLKPELITKELYGDAKVLDYYSKIKKWVGTVKHAQLSLAVLSILTGGSIADSGSTPNEKQAFTWKGSSVGKYFKLEGQCKYLGGSDAGGAGDAHFIAKKCKMSNFEVALQAEDYAVVSFDIEIFATTFDDEGLIIEENETAVAIASTADSTAPTISSTSPANNATNVATNATVQWNFSEKLRPDTATDPANFFVVKDSDGSNVAGSLTHDEANNRVTFTPTSALTASNTVYKAFATTGVRDLAGNRLAATSTTKFTTVA